MSSQANHGSDTLKEVLKGIEAYVTSAPSLKKPKHLKILSDPPDSSRSYLTEHIPEDMTWKTFPNRRWNSFMTLNMLFNRFNHFLELPYDFAAPKRLWQTSIPRPADEKPMSQAWP